MYNPERNPVIGAHAYNLVIGGVVLYGIIVNVLMCYYMAPAIMQINPIVLLIGYFVLAIVGSMITYSSHSPLVSFLGYNLVVLPVGAVLTVCVQGYSTNVVSQAFVLTGIITAVMLLLSTAFPGFFAGIGRMLFVALIGIVIAGFICALLGVYPVIIAWVAAVIFSLYIGYDWVRAQQYVHTMDNAVDSALDIYMDIINLFLQLLAIFGRSDDN